MKPWLIIVAALIGIAMTLLFIGQSLSKDERLPSAAPRINPR